MPKLPEYPAQYSIRKMSLLPRAAQDACYNLGKAIRSNTIEQDQLVKFRGSFRNVAAEAVSQASSEIREIAQIYRAADLYPSGNRGAYSWPFSIISSGTSKQLKQYPDLGWLLIFHGNGFLRQAGVEALANAPQHPFEFSAIVYRLNDWVENVRLAAVEYCKEHLGKTSAGVVAESTFFLLHQARALSRLDQAGQKQLEEAIFRPDVVERLKAEFLGVRTGRVGHTFRQVLYRPEFDQHLHELSTEAALPSIRAIATETLLMRRARWFVGHRKEWVDKRYGFSRRIAEFGSRSIEIIIDGDLVLEKSALDRSAQVRRVAADALIARRHGASDKMDQIAQFLIRDANSSVRSRAEFYIRKQAENV